MIRAVVDLCSPLPASIDSIGGLLRSGAGEEEDLSEMSAQSADDENRPPDEDAAQKDSEDSRVEEGMEDMNPKSPPSVFVNSEPMREEQVENAVKFLSHPKVRGSPVIYRRSFLEKKGLTKEEIDEAFRRVPDSPPSAETSTVTQEGRSGSVAYIQQQAPMQALQPAVAAPSGVIASVQPASRDHFNSYHVKLAIGILAGSAAGTFIFVKKVVIPRLRSWIRSVVLGDVNGVSRDTYLRPSLAEETATAAKAAASAAVDVARASEELLRSKLQEKRFFAEITNMLDVQLREIKSLSVAMKNLQGPANNSVTNTFANRELALPTTFSKQPPYANGKTDWDYREAGRYSTPQASAQPSSAPHPKSYMEIMGMIQRGEKPPNIMDIDDSPPNPNQQISHPRLAPRMKPWEVGQTQRSLNQPFPYQSNPGKVDNNGFVSQSLGNNPGPRWQPSHDLRIPELENQSGMRTWAPNSSSLEQPAKRSWVPPQPPPVAMAEAVEAIRRPKPPVPREQLSDDKKMFGSSEAGVAADGNGVSSELNSSRIQEEPTKQPSPLAVAEASEAIRRPEPTIPSEQLSHDKKAFGSSEAGRAADDNGLPSELN